MTQDDGKKSILSGIQPSGEFTLGNYFGAIKNWTKLQEEFDCIYFIADMHAITVPQVPADLRRRTIECTAMLLASGVDPKKSPVFVQSHVGAHAELCWIFNCLSYMGEMSRMTQFKDKSAKQGENIRVGLFDYPVLMAADILLYNPDLVPVGNDQTQHLELARNLAERFNFNYSETFKVPEGYYGKNGSRIMSLADPTKKMSKSDENANGYILMKDKKDVIISKFKKAVTDSGSEIIFDRDNKPGISNLMEIYGCAAGIGIEEVQREFAGKSYAEFKLAVGETVADALAPIQNEFERISNDKEYINSVLKDGSEQAAKRAYKVLNKVKKKIGYYQI